MKTDTVRALVLVLLFVLVLISSGCMMQSDPPRVLALQGEAASGVVLAFAADPIVPDPDAKPKPDDDTRPKPKPGDTCWNCNGRGKSGDGITPCPQCRGDGRLDQGDPGLNRLLSAVAAAAPVIPAPFVPSPNFPTIDDIIFVELHTSRADGQGWPLKWWREEKPKLSKFANVLIEEIESGEPFIVLKKGETVRVYSEFVGADELNKQIEVMR